MSYYDTLDEDLARAKAILAKGNAALDVLTTRFPPEVADALQKVGGGAIYGADIYAAYKLLESFVREIEDYQRSFDLYDQASRTLMDAYKRAHPEFPQDRWPDAATVNVWAAALIERIFPPHFIVVKPE